MTVGSARPTCRPRGSPVGGTSGFRAASRLPWDKLVPLGDRARAHPDGIVDLSVGTPVDPTPERASRTPGGGRRLARATR